MSEIVIVLWQSTHWLLYLIYQNLNKVQQGEIFSLNFILCSYISGIVYGALKSAHFPHANT